MNVLCFSWAPFGHRMDELSEAVNGRRATLSVLYGPRYLAPIRYVVLFVWTFLLLAKENPDVVYAQNPPVFCPFTALLYCRLAGKKLVIDHHAIWRVKTLGGGLVSGAIGSLERFVSAAAFANTAPHPVWSRLLYQMGAKRVEVIHDCVARNPYSRDESVRRKYSDGRILVVASHGGHPLEMVESEVYAAGMVPSMTLVITGPEEKLGRRLSRMHLPKNVRYLGLLPVEEYMRLKASCDFALNVTEEPYTLSHVLFEYAASSVPIISSRQEVVEAVFGNSILYINSSQPEVVAARLSMLSTDPDQLLSLRKKVASKYEELAGTREEETETLRELLAGP